MINSREDLFKEIKKVVEKYEEENNSSVDDLDHSFELCWVVERELSILEIIAQYYFVRVNIDYTVEAKIEVSLDCIGELIKNEEILCIPEYDCEDNDILVYDLEIFLHDIY